MIKGNENICRIFDIFHDGCIANYQYVDNDLELEIEIRYLAERVKSDYRKFWLRLQNTHSIVFKTWPNDHNAEPECIESLTRVFEPELGILSCEVEGLSLNVACNQPSKNWNYCGGTLTLQADGAIVRDEGKKEYSIEELGAICEKYWSEWEKKNS